MSSAGPRPEAGPGEPGEAANAEAGRGVAPEEAASAGGGRGATPDDAAAPTLVDVGEIIRIVDPELDVDAIMAEIRANLGRRAPLDPDPSSLVYRTGEAGLVSAQDELEWEVEQATDAQRDLGIGEQLRPASGLVGRLASRAKAPLHQLSRFYVDLAVQKQAALQGHVVRALALLVQQSSRSREESAKLRAELEELRRELAALREARP